MPAKRRTSKTRELTNLKMSELWYGPGTCLLAGGGYWHGGFYHELPEDAQAAVLDEMREDWQRHHQRVTAAWDNRRGHDLWIGRNHHADQLRPWAEEEFGTAKDHVAGA